MADAPPDAAGDRSSMMLALGSLLGREVDLDTLLARIVDRITESLSADRGTLYLVDRERGELFSKAAHLPELEEIRLSIGQGIAGVAAAEGRVIALPTVQGDMRFFAAIDQKTGYHTQSVLACPVRDREQTIIGVMQVLNSTRSRFDSADAIRIAELCEEAARIIETTSLYSELRKGGRAVPIPLPVHYRYNRIVGESEAMRRVYDLTRRAAATSATVLIRGESGTGKELIARAIHFNSTRRDRPFVKVDCTTLPPTLIENELFGHEKGAFTGADRRHAGKCELAEGGTLFVDELGELPLAVQGKLLRFVQDHEFERVGGRSTERADVRIVAATHRDLEAMVRRGEFREDLYYRVKVVQIALPALRERGPSDLARLAGHFLEVYCRKHGKGSLTLSHAAVERLSHHRWPGNIRELEHCIESAVVLCESGVIDPAHLTLPAQGSVPAMHKLPDSSAITPEEGFIPRRLADVEREHIVRTVESVAGNRTRAAELLGIGRNTLLAKLKEYGMA